jgi:HEAT repeat protein
MGGRRRALGFFLGAATLIAAPDIGIGRGDLEAQGSVARAWKILQDGVTNEHEETRIAALHSLGLLVKNDRARKLAESKLSDPESEVRSAAADALGQIALPAAVPVLKAAVMKDKESEVVFSAASALYRIGDPSAYQVYYAVLTGQRKTGEPLLESQLDMLKDPEALAKIGFETGIGFIPFGGISYKAFKTFHQDNVSPVRAAAAQRLATDPDPHSGKALAVAAADEKWVVRASAISALARRGDKSFLPAVEARLDDEQLVVRFNAAAAVARLSDAKR